MHIYINYFIWLIDFEKKTMVKIDDEYNLYNSRGIDHIVLRHALIKPSECLFKPYLIGVD